MSGQIPKSGQTRGPRSPLFPNRMDSCISDPQQELLQTFKEQNLRVFIDLLNDDNVDVNKEYIGEKNKTLLHLAVENGNNEFAKELLRIKQCDPNIPNKNTKTFPLHIAVDKGNVDLTSLLIRSGADINVKQENGNTPLHIASVKSAANSLTGNAKYIMIQNMKDIVALLLNQETINFDLENNIGFTPLFFAADRGTEEVVRMLLKKGACITAEVEDEDDDSIDTVEDKINKRFPSVLREMETSRNRQSNNAPEAVLFKLLYEEFTNPGGFEEKLEEYIQQKRKVNLNFDNGSYTMLQYCCYHGYHHLVEFLLSNGADPNHTCDNNRIPPVVWAAHHGYHEVIKVFKRRFLDDQHPIYVDFARVDEKNDRSENVLHKILKAESRAHVNKHLRNYDECLKLLLDDDNYRFKNNIAGAINGKDNLGNTPLHIAAQMGNHEAVRKLLRCEANLGMKNVRELTPIVHIAPDIMEEFLDDCLQSEGSPTSKDFQITFNYSFLGPPRERKYPIDKEQTPLLGKSGEKEELSNIKEMPETEPLWYMAQIKEHRYLLSHPTITSFLWMKWRKMRPYFYLNVFFYLIFFTFLTSYILLMTENIDQGVEETQNTSTVKWITFIFLVLFTIREVTQLTVSYRRYIFNIENVLESALIILTYILMFGNVNPGNVKMISAIILLLSWVEVVFLIGGHPRFSTYITMFKEISFNFTKFLSLFLSLIIGFGLCFFILYHGAKDEDGKELNEYFSSPSKALLKTLIISLTGEIEFADIEFGNWLGWVIFLIFVFFIMLVLVNLLNGLAVSDIAQIQKEAEIMSHISRVELMCQIESILLGDPFSFLENFPQLPKVARKLPTCNILSSIYRLSCINKIFSIFGSKHFLLFSNRLWRKEAVFFPNRHGGKKEAGGGDTEGCLRCNDLVLTESILEQAKGLVIKRNTITEEQEMKKQLKDMEKALHHVISLINDMKSG